jgi:hypothetical protein
LNGVSPIGKELNLSAADQQEGCTPAETAEVSNIREMPYENCIELLLLEFFLQSMQATVGAHLRSLSHLGKNAPKRPASVGLRLCTPSPYRQLFQYEVAISVWVIYRSTLGWAIFHPKNNPPA